MRTTTRSGIHRVPGASPTRICSTGRTSNSARNTSGRSSASCSLQRTTRRSSTRTAGSSHSTRKAHGQQCSEIRRLCARTVFRKRRAHRITGTTLFFLSVADHNSRVYGSDLVPVERFHIPGLILGGSIAAGGVYPGRQPDRPGANVIVPDRSHRRAPDDRPRSDASGSTDGSPGRAIMQFSGIQAYMEGDEVAVLQKDMPVRQFHYRGRSFVERDDNNRALVRRAIAHAAWSSLAYEKSLYRLPSEDERLTWHPRAGCAWQPN